MTHADTPLLATRGLIENPRNPWTGTALTANKAAGVTVIASRQAGLDKHGVYTFAVQNGEWLRVKDNIFLPENWSKGP